MVFCIFVIAFLSMMTIHYRFSRRTNFDKRKWRKEPLAQFHAVSSLKELHIDYYTEWKYQILGIDEKKRRLFLMRFENIEAEDITISLNRIHKVLIVTSRKQHLLERIDLRLDFDPYPKNIFFITFYDKKKHGSEYAFQYMKRARAWKDIIESKLL